jgi:hypothetical protein
MAPQLFIFYFITSRNRSMMGRHPSVRDVSIVGVRRAEVQFWNMVAVPGMSTSVELSGSYFTVLEDLSHECTLLF